MRQRRTVFWVITGSVVALAAVAIALIQHSSGSSPKSASSSAPPSSAGGSTQPSESAPVVVPKTSGTSSLSYLSDLHPSGDLSELVNPGPVKIAGSIYPKSISFYCNVGDPTPFPVYTLTRKDRRFQVTLGLPAGSPTAFRANVMLIGDGHTFRSVTVSVQKPDTLDVPVQGLHTLKLECFGSGNSYTGGEAVAIEWGNARISEGR